MLGYGRRLALGDVGYAVTDAHSERDRSNAVSQYFKDGVLSRPQHPRTLRPRLHRCERQDCERRDDEETNNHRSAPSGRGSTVSGRQVKRSRESPVMRSIFAMVISNSLSF
jgi:hypothetical protein